MLTRETIREVILAQRRFLDETDLGIVRTKEGFSIQEAFALIITGVRRCGKSTFMNQLLRGEKKGGYLNLEDPRLEGFEFSDFTKVDEIMKELYGEKAPLFFDEIQNIEKWEKFIRYLIDRKERIVITGSNARLLSRELGTKLTGRHLQLEMFPFSFQEFLQLQGQRPTVELFELYLYRGGFPEYLKKQNPSILQELLSDVVMKDIAVRYGIKNTDILTKILGFLISNCGKEFSYNSIKKAFFVKSVQSVIDYISYFENSYLIFTVPRFSYSYQQQQISPKKVYSIDNGFSYNNSVLFSKDKGRMLENIVFLGLRRKYKQIFYYKEINECDFLVKEKEKIVSAIQVCYDLHEENKNRELNGLVTALLKFNLQQGFILTYNQRDEFIVDGKKIIVKPAWEWLLED